MLQMTTLQCDFDTFSVEKNYGTCAGGCDFKDPFTGQSYWLKVNLTNVSMDQQTKLRIEAATDLKDRPLIELSLNIIAPKIIPTLLPTSQVARSISHCYYFYLTGSLKTDLEYSSGNTFSWRLRIIKVLLWDILIFIYQLYIFIHPEQFRLAEKWHHRWTMDSLTIPEES